MLTKTRTAYDTLVLILKTISKKPCNTTAIYHELRTSFTLMVKTRVTAMRFKLIEQKGSKYHITPKGLEFLETWKKLQSLLTETKGVQVS